MLWAQSQEVDPRSQVCLDAEGEWVSSDESCAPCNLCLSDTGEVRIDQGVLFPCPPSCDSWCECPDGQVWNGSSCILIADSDLSSCIDETPYGSVCIETGGQMGVVQSCPGPDYCIDSDGQVVNQTPEDIFCPTFDQETCICPSNKVWVGLDEGCQLIVEVAPSCEDMGGQMEDSGGQMEDGGGQMEDGGGQVEDGGGQMDETDGRMEEEDEQQGANENEEKQTSDNEEQSQNHSEESSCNQNPTRSQFPIGFGFLLLGFGLIIRTKTTSAPLD